MTQEIGNIFYSFLIDRNVSARKFRNTPLEDTNTDLKKALEDIGKNSVTLFGEFVLEEFEILKDEDIFMKSKESSDVDYRISFEILKQNKTSPDAIYVKIADLFKFYKAYCIFSNCRAVEDKYFKMDLSDIFTFSRIDNKRYVKIKDLN